MLNAWVYGECHFSKYFNCYKIHPLLYFYSNEVWHLTNKWKLPVNPAYERVPRVGCSVCTAHIGWEGQIARANPRLYEYIQRKRGMDYQMALPLRGRGQ